MIDIHRVCIGGYQIFTIVSTSPLLVTVQYILGSEKRNICISQISCSRAVSSRTINTLSSLPSPSSVNQVLVNLGA